jgi:hypothetical protein
MQGNLKGALRGRSRLFNRVADGFGENGLLVFAVRNTDVFFDEFPGFAFS